MELGTGCCGADFRTERVSALGLLTLSVPLILACAPAALLLAPWPARARVPRVLLRANLELVRAAALAPRLRCAASARLYALSPRLAGLAHRWFNLAALLVPWAALAAAAATLALVNE